MLPCVCYPLKHNDYLDRNLDHNLNLDFELDLHKFARNNMSLLSLPTELRHEIYFYLTPKDDRTCPFKEPNVCRISNKPPPSALLRACRFLYKDGTAYFYSIATIQIIADFFPSIAAADVHSMRAIRRVKKIEILMVWKDGLETTRLLGGYEWPYNKMLEMKTIHILNAKAECLEKLIVVVLDRAWKDVPWEAKAERLDQLREVKAGVTISVGKGLTVHGSKYERSLEANKFVEEINEERG